MRAPPVPVVLSSIISIVLAGWLTGAAAQEAGSLEPPTAEAAPSGQLACPDVLASGGLPQPTLSCPGLVTGISLGELYTDNLRLAANNQPKQSSWITVVQPFVRVAHDGPRLSGVLDYTLSAYLYPSRWSDNQVAQDLSAGGTYAIVPQHFFLQGTALYNRAVINNQLPAASGAFFLNNNQANVAMGTLSPYWLQDLGNVGTMMLRYTYGRVMYNESGISGTSPNRLSGIPDVTSNAVQFSLVSPKYETWGWDVEYSQQQLDPDFGPGVQFAAAKVGASLEVAPDIRLLADAGKENKFLPNGTYEHLGAGFWDVGIDWANLRDEVKLLFGHRFFGRNIEFSWTHRAALLVTDVSYTERPTDLNQQLMGENPAAIATTPLMGGVGGLGGVYGIPSLTNRQVYLMKRAAASATLLMPRGNLRLNLYNESRTFFYLNTGREKVTDADLSWGYELGALTTLIPTVGWQRYRFQDASVRYMHYAQLELRYQPNLKNFGTIRLRNESSSVFAGAPGVNGYRVNVIFLRWTHLF